MTLMLLGQLAFAAGAWLRAPVVHAQPDSTVSRKGGPMYRHRIPLVLGVSALVVLVGALGLAQAIADHQVVTSSGGGLQQPTCPGSKKALGGGGWATDGTALYRTGPQAGGAGWAANAQNDNAITAYAICAELSAVGGIAELTILARASAQGPVAPAEGSGWSAGNYAALAGGLTPLVLVAAAGAWCARRRWLRRRA